MIKKRDFDFSNEIGRKRLSSLLPDEFQESLERMKELPLYELIEQILAMLDVSKAKDEEAWNAMFAEYCAKYPEMKEAWDAEFNMDIAKDLIDNEEFWAYDEKPEATRNLSGVVLNRLKNYMKII